jgi:3-hydroxyethyl bacteriochlorophyllide a dehydrogenase
LSPVELAAPGEDDLVVDVEWSGISTGTEKLLWSGRMPPFPGMGYPLIPGYECVGRIAAAGRRTTHRVGERVFVPGARCYPKMRSLFGGAAARVVAPSARVMALGGEIGEHGVLAALAATAHHAIAAPGGRLPELIVGHGVLGRLLARLTIALGGDPPRVWERNPARLGGAEGYEVCAAEADARSDYRSIYDASGDAGILDALTARLARGGEVTLAGFYAERLSFDFAPAFMRETKLRIAAEWRPLDIAAVDDLLARGRLSLAGLITHRAAAADAAAAYVTAFSDPNCLKMVLDWRTPL